MPDTVLPNDVKPVAVKPDAVKPDAVLPQDARTSVVGSGAAGSGARAVADVVVGCGDDADSSDGYDGHRGDDGRGMESAPRYRTVALDVLRDGDSLVVLSGTTVRVLAGIAPVIVEAAEVSRTEAELVAAVVAVHGMPSGEEGAAESLMRAAVAELVDAGVLAVA
ncbi:hypothetical protein GCM10009563_23830 [Subtercola frigoramans]